MTNMDPIMIGADYHRTPFGSWTAMIEALLDPEEDRCLFATVAGPTLKGCQENVLILVKELSDENDRPCYTMHLIDGDPVAFVQKYIEEGFEDGWVQGPDDNYYGPNGETIFLAEPSRKESSHQRQTKKKTRKARRGRSKKRP